MSPGRLALPLLLAACAGANATTKTDDAVAAKKDPLAAPTNDELSSAFDPEREKPKAEVKPPPPPADPAEAFKASLASADAAFKSKDLAGAKSAAESALQQAIDGEGRNQAGALLFKIVKASGDASAAQEAATTWRLACGPEKVDTCRGAALGALGSVAKLKGADKSLLKQVRELQDAETCAVKAEKGAPQNPCEATAIRVAQREKDPFVAARVQLGIALREESEGKQWNLLERAEGTCELPQCAGLRRKALGKLIAIARQKNDVDVATKLALREVKVVAEGAPASLRHYARTPMLDQTCVSYDTAHGAGSCRTLEKKELGFWTFHDYSKGPSGQGLTPDQVRMVNDHYAPLLQECLADQAKRMIPPDAQRFEVRWLVFNDGRVGEAHLRKDLDEWPLAKCLRAQFDAWRYPRYEGEFQHVQQSFTVSAVERRQLR